MRKETTDIVILVMCRNGKLAIWLCKKICAKIRKAGDIYHWENSCDPYWEHICQKKNNRYLHHHK